MDSPLKRAARAKEMMRFGSTHSKETTTHMHREMRVKYEDLPYAAVAACLVPKFAFQIQ
jgi:hypothetical protein